jgi:hypothetical protein
MRYDPLSFAEIEMSDRHLGEFAIAAQAQNGRARPVTCPHSRDTHDHDGAFRGNLS